VRQFVIRCGWLELGRADYFIIPLQEIMNRVMMNSEVNAMCVELDSEAEHEDQLKRYLPAKV